MITVQSAAAEMLVRLRSDIDGRQCKRAEQCPIGGLHSEACFRGFNGNGRFCQIKAADFLFVLIHLKKEPETIDQKYLNKGYVIDSTSWTCFPSVVNVLAASIPACPAPTIVIVSA